MLPSRAASTWVWKLSSSASAAGLISGLLRFARCAGVTVTQPDATSRAGTTAIMQTARASERVRNIAGTLPDSGARGKRGGRLVLSSIFGIMRGGLTDAEQPARVVVIDGPAGAGKSTIARNLARRLGLSMLDTGAIYRTLALAARRANVAWDDEAGLASLCSGLPIRFETLGDGTQKVLLDGDDVSEAIRTADITAGASQVSAHPAVRAQLLSVQRALGAHGCVAEGRDMGTVVFPDASHKFFLTASPLVRAMRRRDERLARGDADVPSVDDVRRAIEERDLRDSTREAAPLAQAEDAVRVDTSEMDPDAVVECLLGLIEGAPPSSPSPGG